MFRYPNYTKNHCARCDKAQQQNSDVVILRWGLVWKFCCCFFFLNLNRFLVLSFFDGLILMSL